MHEALRSFAYLLSNPIPIEFPSNGSHLRIRPTRAFAGREFREQEDAYAALPSLEQSPKRRLDVG